MSENLQKRRKYVSHKLRNSDMDMLSNLPDSIICQIISKLQTKEAVKTCVLSSRYKSLWMYITSLKFTYKQFGGDGIRLAHFTNMVLIFLKSKSINEFCLTVTSPCNLCDILTWVRAAIYKNVKVLNLSIHGRKEIDNGISMPACLYTSNTLEVLDIRNKARVNLSLNVPEFVSLPKLTTLKLGYVNYSSDESARRLISGCSSLEKLTIQRDVFEGVTTFNIDSLTLKKLYYGFDSSDDSIEQDYKLELNAPALIFFHLRDGTTRDFSINLKSLEHANTLIASSTNIESHYERVGKFLQKVHNVNHLWISGDTLEALSHAPSPQEYSRSILTMNTKYSKQSSLQDLLDGSAILHDIYLAKDSSDTIHVVRWSQPQKLPICLLSDLKTISVSGFRGREGELTIYILKNAKMLKKISISEKSELREKILKFDQGSEKCEIIFS